MRIQSEYQQLVRRCVRIGKHLGYTVKVIEVEEDGIGIEVGDFEFRVIREDNFDTGNTYSCYVILPIPATYHEPPDFDEKFLGSSNNNAEYLIKHVFNSLNFNDLTMRWKVFLNGRMNDLLYETKIFGMISTKMVLSLDRMN